MRGNLTCTRASLIEDVRNSAAEALTWVREVPGNLRRFWYLRGRVMVGGRRLRYDACTDIPLVVLTILGEFAEDCESPYFCSAQEETMSKVRPLIIEGELIQHGVYDEAIYSTDAYAWANWLGKVSEILPELWD